MKIGVPTEVKNNENRVSLTPAGADRLIHEGHRVLVQSGAGLGRASATTTTAPWAPRSFPTPRRRGARPTY